ncbi:MAG: threonine-phosphate decarboxylase [Candidatus Manganitrophaceae bacterium]|nr:MAG: threonine-phosphate decarboxylase [Candidatus Manganitrophaceae bacterium]
MDTGHGGNLAAVCDQYGWLPEEIIDFSASINPFGPPEKASSTFRESFRQITTYPDPNCRRLRRRLGAVLSVPSDQILIGNGSTELIFLIPRAFSPRSVLIFCPTYQDYEASAQAARCQVQFALLPLAPTVDHFYSALSDARSTIDLVFLCNPNNPTGSCLSTDALAWLIKRHPSVLFVIDEAYGDFVDEESTLLRRPLPKNVIVLRSFTKIYSIPSLRLGFAIAREEVIEKLNRLKEPWSVNGAALSVGECLLEEKAFVEKSRIRIRKEREFLFDQFKRMTDLEAIPSETNFLLIQRTDRRSVEPLKQSLIRKKVLIRSCRNFRGLGRSFFRIAVKKRDENRKLVDLLKERMQ